MRLYPEASGPRSAMIVADLLVLLWVVLAVSFARAVQAAVEKLAAPGKGLEQAGRDIAGSFGRAADQSGGLPIIGDRLADPLRSASGAGSRLAEAGVAEQTAANQLGFLLALVLTFLAVLPVLFWWVPRRARWVLEASAAARLRKAGGPEALTLLAIRGAARSPLVRVAAAGGRGMPFAVADPEAVEALARLELRSLGLLPVASNLPPRRHQ